MLILKPEVNIKIDRVINGISITVKNDPKIESFFRHVSTSVYDNYFTNGYVPYKLEYLPPFLYYGLGCDRNSMYSNLIPNMNPLNREGSSKHPRKLVIQGMYDDPKINQYVNDLERYTNKLLNDVVSPYFISRKHAIKKGYQVRGSKFRLDMDHNWIFWYDYYKDFVIKKPKKVKKKSTTISPDNIFSNETQTIDYDMSTMTVNTTAGTNLDSRFRA